MYFKDLEGYFFVIWRDIVSIVEGYLIPIYNVGMYFCIVEGYIAVMSRIVIIDFVENSCFACNS